MANKRDPWVPLRLSLPFSEKINGVSIGAEMLYVRLLAQCDDGSNYWGSSKQILALLCSLRWENGQVQEGEIRAWRDELVGVGLAEIYEVAGREYLHLIAVKKILRNDVLRDERFPQSPTEPGLPDGGPDAGRAGAGSGPSEEEEEEEEEEDTEGAGPEIHDIELPDRKHQATDATQHLNNLIRSCTAAPLLSVTEDQVRAKLFGAGIPPEDVGAVSADDLKAAVKEWRDHQKEVRSRNPTGRAPNFGLGYLKNVIQAKRDAEWRKEKAQPAGPAAELVHFPAADPRTRYWESLSTREKQANVDAIRLAHPELQLWKLAAYRWLTENEHLWQVTSNAEGGA